MINLVGKLSHGIFRQEFSEKISPTIKGPNSDAIMHVALRELPKIARLIIDRSFHGDTSTGTRALLAIAQKMIADNVDAERGLALLRTLPKLQTNRHAMVSVSILAASFDEEFGVRISGGDQARNHKRWKEGEFNYWAALSLYPHHVGYFVQYAHCLKEQGKFVDSECYYRHALALGAPFSDVAEHLIFVARQSAFDETDSNLLRQYGDAQKPSQHAAALSLTPSKTDVDTLVRTFLQRPVRNLEETLHLLRRCPTRAHVVIALIQEDDFRKEHRDLISVVATTRKFHL